MKDKKYFEGFEHPASAIKKYIAAADVFTLSLADGKIIHYTPEDPKAFLTWLEAHQVKDIRKGL